ncbi:MAG: RES family NAD+ phosphorylase [Pseudomonadota bacterium]
MPLKPPPTGFSGKKLPTKSVSVESLVRIGGRSTGEPYFGARAANRFDDPGKSYGTAYFGRDLTTAIAETVLHDQLPDGGKFKVVAAAIDTRFVVTCKERTAGEKLKLAKLTGVYLKRMGGDNKLSAEYPYGTTQQWSAAVQEHPDMVDGFVYVSNQLNDKEAVVVFDRAKAKFGDVTYTPLRSAKGLKQAIKRLGIEIVDP